MVWRFDGSADGRANQSQTLGFRKSVKSVEFLLVGVGRLFAFYWPALPYEEYGKPIDWVQFQRFKYDPTTHIRDQTLQLNNCNDRCHHHHLKTVEMQITVYYITNQ